MKEGKAYIGDEIESGNKLIAAFDIKGLIHPHDLKYDSSWEWVMPVVKKCYELNQSSGFGLFNAIDFYSGNIFGVWESVVKFITWYNTQNKQS